MSKHVRQQIREAFVAALKGLPTTGANVFKTRNTPSSDASLPALLVYTRQERSQFDAMGDSHRPLQRQLQVWVVGVCRATGTPDDLLDRICAEVEPVLAAAATAAGLLEKVELAATDFDVSTDGGDKAKGRVGMTWRVTYRTAAADPTAPV